MPNNTINTINTINTGNTCNNVNPYLKYTIYGRFNNNVCGRRCKTLVQNKLFQKCTCK